MHLAATAEEIAQALELLQPERLLIVRKDLDHLDDAMKAELRNRLQPTCFPLVWASRLQSILLLLHEGYAKNPTGFINQVFLPWVKLRHDLRPRRHRIGRDMARIKETAEESIEETEHFIALYRSLVSDLLDPYATLLVACHQFVAESFADIESANFNLGEFNKVEFVQSAMRKRGDAAELFKGYNAKVRNAISHAGSHGVTIEGRSILFRDIRRGPAPVVSPVRWSADELGVNTVLMAELLDCIDAATEIFGLDCVNVDDVDFPTLLQVVDAAFTPIQRADLRAKMHDHLGKIWSDRAIPDQKRREILAEILSEQYRLRNMALRGFDLGTAATILLIAVPREGPLDTDQAIRSRLLELTRYLILARSVFGPFGGSLLVAETDEAAERHRLLVTVPSELLDDYANEKAGLIDLLKGGKFQLGPDRIEVFIDEDALAELEDQSLGRALVRRDRAPSSRPD
jgi:hypothetical protein